jgi:hypothetical protein
VARFDIITRKVYDLVFQVIVCELTCRDSDIVRDQVDYRMRNAEEVSHDGEETGIVALALLQLAGPCMRLNAIIIS